MRDRSRSPSDEQIEASRRLEEWEKDGGMVPQLCSNMV